MPVSRISFVIGSSESVHGQLQGVSADHESYHAFLASDGGGAWEHDEVIHLASPSRRELRAALNHGALRDFAMVIFAGHGFHRRSDGETYVCVNDHEDVPVYELNTGAKRQVTTVDACRAFLREDGARAERGREVRMGADRSAAERYRRSCRLTYDRALIEADEGVVRLFAASPGQAADETSLGGKFSRAMLGGAVGWTNAVRKSSGDAHTHLPVNGAVEIAKKQLAERREPQIPHGEFGRRLLHFPFAVA